jgi:hypothetical protein
MLTFSQRAIGSLQHLIALELTAVWSPNMQSSKDRKLGSAVLFTFVHQHRPTQLAVAIDEVATLQVPAQLVPTFSLAIEE